MTATLAEVVAGDYEALAAFMATAWSSPRAFWESRFRVWWDDNPAFAGFALPRGWSLKDRGSIVGFLGNVPSLFWANERTLAAVNTSSWIVEPAHRSGLGSLALLSRQLEAAKDAVLFNATPTDAVLPIFLRMGCRPLPWGGQRESFIVIDAAACARAKVPLLARVPGAAQAAGLALFARQASRLSLLSPLAVRRLEEAGPRFDELWERTRGAYAATNVRSAAAIGWHCFRDPEFPKVLLGCFDGKRLCGYMILRPKSRRGLSVLECCDLWTDPPLSRDATAALVFAARQAADEGNHDLLMLPHFTGALAGLYAELGLIQGQAPPRKYLYKAPAALSEAIESGRGYFCALQGDAGSAP